METIEELDHSHASLNASRRELLAEVSQPPLSALADLDGLLDPVPRATEQSYQSAGPSYLVYNPGGGCRIMFPV